MYVMVVVRILIFIGFLSNIIVISELDLLPFRKRQILIPLLLSVMAPVLRELCCILIIMNIEVVGIGNGGEV